MNLRADQEKKETTTTRKTLLEGYFDRKCRKGRARVFRESDELHECAAGLSHSAFRTSAQFTPLELIGEREASKSANSKTHQKEVPPLSVHEEE